MRAPMPAWASPASASHGSLSHCRWESGRARILFVLQIVLAAMAGVGWWNLERQKQPPLRQHPVAVSGRVVDASGSPMSGAHVSVEEIDPALERIALSFSADTRTQADGNFEVRGYLPTAPTLGVEAYTLSSKSRRIEVATGSTGVVLRCVPAGSLAGEIADWNPAMKYKITLQVDGDDGSTTLATISPKGTFRTLPLLPGRYSLRVTLGSAPLHTFEGLVVDPGPATHPAELEGLRLALWTEETIVRVRDEAGHPLRAVIVFSAASEDAPFGWRTTTDEDGRAWMVRPTGAALDLWVKAEGYPTTTLDNQTTFPLEMTLHPPMPITLDLDRALPNSPSGSWHVFLGKRRSPESIRAEKKALLEDGSTRAPRLILPESGAFLSNGERSLRLTLPRIGTFAVVAQPDPTTGPYHPIDLGTVEIPDRTTETVSLSVPPAAIDDLERLAQQL